MSRKVLPQLYLYLLAFFVSTTCTTAGVVPENCLELDVDVLEEYLLKLDLGNVPTIDMMIGQFKCPVTALPFGALKSDWARLLLLERAQPKESTLREKLGRLFRILVIAYFEMEERFDITSTEFQTIERVNASTTYETTSIGDLKNDREELGTSLANEIAKSFISSIPFGDREAADTIEIEPTISMTRDVAGGGGDDSNRIHNRISSTTAVSSPVDSNERIEIGEKETAEATSETIFSVITVSSTISIAEQEHTEASDNYLNNYTVREDSSWLNEDIVTQLEKDTNDDKGVFLEKEIQSTIEDFIEDESSASDLMKESTVDSFKTGGSTTNGFIGEESSVSEVDAERNTINNVTNKIELITLSTFESDTPITRTNNNFSVIKSSVSSDTLKTDSVGYQTSTVQDVEGKETSASTPIADMQATSIKFVENKIKGTGGRGDSPIFEVPMDSEEEDGNEIDEEEGSKLNAVQYLDTTGSDLAKSANTSSSEITDIKSTTERNHIHSDKILENDATGSTESFARNRPNHRKDIFQDFKKTSGNLPNSTLYRNKIRKPSVSMRPPVDNEFWRYIVISQNVTLPAPTTLSSTRKLSDRTEQTNASAGDLTKSKKRGSLNTNVEKNFRWFYSFGQEDKKRASDNRRRIHIECNGVPDREGK